MRPGSWVAGAKRPTVTASAPWTGCDTKERGVVRELKGKRKEAVL